MNYQKLQKLKCLFVCAYPATLDVVVFLLQALLDTGFVFVCDENKTPSFFRFGINGKFNGFNLKEKDGGVKFKLPNGLLKTIKHVSSRIIFNRKSVLI